MSETNVYIINQIDDSSWRIEDNGSRILMFAGTDKALLVDTGYGSGKLRETVAELTGLPVMLVNTHADYDHIGGNAQFERAFMHPSEFARYRAELAKHFPTVGDTLAVSPLWEGDVIDLGGRSFEVILIPGHTPGSIALLDSKNRILIGGDSVIDDRIVLCDAWRDIDAYILSMEKLNGMRSRFDTVYTPHGSFPVSSDILEGIVSGIKRSVSGEVKGVDTDFIKGKKLYDTGTAIFVY